MTALAQDRTMLRELAAQVAEIAALPVQQETKALWQALNGLKPVRPMVSLDQVCWHEMNVDDELTLRCEDGFCRGLEWGLRETLYRWRHMRADMVVEPWVDVSKAVGHTGFGIGVEEKTSVLDPANSVVGHYYLDQMKTEADLDRITMPVISHDEAGTAAAEEKAREMLDGILGVHMQGPQPVFAPLDIIVCWHGVEALLFDMADRPEFVHAMIAKLTAAQLSSLDQMEAQGLLGDRQQTIHCTGAWTDELPYEHDGTSAKNLWTFGMSQIFSTVSPAMHEAFEAPALVPWFERFGLGYYGCCEPVDRKLAMIRKYPRVRKISMSPWVDVEFGASEIGGDFVFSRKPSPAFLARDWNPDAVAADLQETVDACARHGCPCELILKDISTVRYEPQRLWEWAETARRVVGA
jgi:hypothetical protein